MDNAIKFSNSGNEVELVCKVQDEGVKISIKDEGVGMDEGFLSKRFFKPFEQESEGYGRKFEGLGLGAYITYASIVKMQGKIICHSEKGKGTIVELTIPNID